MKRLIKAMIVTLALSFTTLYAGSGHSHDGGHGHNHTQTEVNKETIKKKANQKLSLLIKKGKLNKSWSKVSIMNMKKKQFNHNTEWVVSFKNEAIKNKEEKILYIFVSLSGNITGANYTGK